MREGAKPARSKPLNPNQKENVMSKGQNIRKGSKKEPAKTMKEKKAAKREKRNEKANLGILDQLHKAGNGPV
jgi:hypothetical protein